MESTNSEDLHISVFISHKYPFCVLYPRYTGLCIPQHAKSIHISEAWHVLFPLSGLYFSHCTSEGLNPYYHPYCDCLY